MRLFFSFAARLVFGMVPRLPTHTRSNRGQRQAAAPIFHADGTLIADTHTPSQRRKGPGRCFYQHDEACGNVVRLRLITLRTRTHTSVSPSLTRC